MSGKRSGGSRAVLTFAAEMRKNWLLYLMFAPCGALFLIFSYFPMYGIIIAFKDYDPFYGMFWSEWADPFYKFFLKMFADPYFLQVSLNTLKISGLRILFGFPAPIFLALLLNEVRLQRAKRAIQTITYLPFFLSWIILAGMMRTMFLTDGIVNNALHAVGIPKISFFTNGPAFLSMIIVSDIWKNVGFGSIIYLAAIAGISQDLYEAAKIDGADRLRCAWHITMPGLSVAVSINLILSLSGILNAGFDQIFNMYNQTVYDSADIIDTYVFRAGIGEGQYAFATALGLVKSVIGFALILIVNRITNKVWGSGVW